MIVLDTHAWIWWVSESEPLSVHARAAIERGMAEKTIYISSISAWEVALLVERGRLELTMDVTDWVMKSEQLPFVNFVPIDNRLAIRANRLPDERIHLPRDPADRMIIATSLSLGAPILTKDAKIRGYPHVETIW